MCSVRPEHYLAAMDTIHRGNAAEAAVLHRLVSAGIHVFLPFGGGLPFDLGAVLPPEGRLARIQVKSGRIRSGCIEFNTWSTDHGQGRGSYLGRADLIAVQVPEWADILMVPVEECIPFRRRFRIDPPRNNQRTGVRFADDYKFDHWLRTITATADSDADRPHLRHPPPEGPSADPGRLRRAAGGG